MKTHQNPTPDPAAPNPNAPLAPGELASIQQSMAASRGLMSLASQHVSIGHPLASQASQLQAHWVRESDNTALVNLLVEKGVLTRAEYLQAVATMRSRKVQQLHAQISSVNGGIDQPIG